MEAARLERGRLLTDLCHDLRASLNPIAIRTALGLDPALSDTQRLAQLRFIQRSVAEMRALLDGVADLAGVAEERLPLDARRWWPASLIDAAVALEAERAAAASVRVVTAVAGGLPPILADRARIVRVLAALLRRAPSVCAGGGSVAVRADFVAGGARFSASGQASDGAGAPGDDAGGLEAVERGGEGTAVAIARAVVGAHGGEVCNAPVRDGGFSFTLPCGSGAGPSIL